MSMIYLLIGAFTLLSICAGTIMYLSLRNLDSKNPKTVSFAVAQSEKVLRTFRFATFFGVLALAAAIVLFIMPKIEHSLIFATSCSVTYLSAILLSFIPDKKGFEIFEYSLHNVFAWIVALGVATNAALLGFSPNNPAAFIEFSLLTLMLALSVAATVNRKKFVYYEHAFILASHISIFIAVIALY